MTKITVDLQASEREALRQLARRERRDIGDQAAIFIRRQLEQEGALRPLPELKPAAVGESPVVSEQP